MSILVIGARGALGAQVMAELAARGVRAIPAGRGDDYAASGATAIVHCAGASLALGLGHGWRGYRAVDVPLGDRVIEAARRSGARLVYVAAHHPPGMRGCAYVAAHERVAEAMTDLDGVVVRATGFFAAFASFLPLARRGLLLDVGAGDRRTNPIAEGDLARIVVDAALDRATPRALSVGGPEIATRRELLAQVAAAAGRRVRIVGTPVWAARLGAAALRPLHPRIAQLVAFAAGLARHDTIAPAVGATTLAAYLASRSTPSTTWRAIG